MIFITRDHSERPLFTGFVNGVTERTMQNGGTIKTYTLGTSEKKQDDTRVYSSWFCTLMGNARKAAEYRPLVKGDRINVYGFKQTNVSQKNPDGTWGKAFLNVIISDYTLFENQEQGYQEKQLDEENPF